MKRILSIFIFILFCYPSYAMNVVMISGEGTSTAGSSCNKTYYSETNPGAGDATSADDAYEGNAYFYPNAVVTVCKLGVNLYADPGGATISIGIYADSSGNLGSLIVGASGAVTGTGWKEFDVTPTALSAGTNYHIAVKQVSGRISITRMGTPDTTNLPRAAGGWGYYGWAANGSAAGGSSSIDSGLRVYTQ